MPNDKEFWKELLGDDDVFKEIMGGTSVGDSVSGGDESSKNALEDTVIFPKAEEKTKDIFTNSLGFKIEYVSKDGETISSADKSGGAVPKEEGTKTRNAGEKTGTFDDFETKPIPRAAPEKRGVSSPAKKTDGKEAPAPKKPLEVKPLPKKAETGRTGSENVPSQAKDGKKSGPDIWERFIAKKETKKLQEELSEEITGPKNFEVDFNFDEEYQDAEEKPVKRGRGRRFGCLGGILYFLFILTLSIGLACLGWMAAMDVLGLGGENKTVEVTLEKSLFSDVERMETDDKGNEVTKTVTVADIDAVAEVLQENGLIKYKWLFKIYSMFSSADEKVKAGSYELNYNYDYRSLVHAMTPSGGARVEIDVTIPEGYTITQIANLLDNKRVCDKNEFLDAATNYDFDYEFLEDETLGDKKRLEGYLFPDTYTFYVGDTPSRVINKLLTNFNKKWTDEFSERAEELGYSMRDILTIASMIEKEAGADSERAIISSVMHNRLNHPDRAGTNGLLQIDATIYYAIEDTGEEFSTVLDSPYNTYLYPGLPAGPIANPGLASIKAALYPESSSYYYYALGQDKLHQFFKTFNEFQNFINSDKYGG